MERQYDKTKAINTLMDNVIKRVLMTPQSTPRETLSIETGLMDPERSHKQRIMMNHRIANSDNERLQILATPDEANHWQKLTDESMRKTGTSTEELQGKKHRVKLIVKNKTATYFKNKIEEDGKEKS